MPEPAARLRDPISHSPSLGLLAAGALIGGGLAVLAVVTAPVSVPVLIGGAMIAGGAVAGAGIGEFLGGYSFMRSTAGAIADPCSSGVFVNNRRAARAHLDLVDCSQHGRGPMIAEGSDSVCIDGWNAARKGDRTACDARIEAGSPDVVIGGGTHPTDAISPEVPDIVHKAMFVVGLGSAMVLFGPEMAILGLAGGMLGGKVMSDIGGAVFGEGSDGQRTMAFAGSFLGGLGTAKGVGAFNRNFQVRQTGLGMNGGGISITRRPPAAPAGPPRPPAQPPSPFQTRVDPAYPGRPDPRWSVDTRNFDPRAAGAGRTATGEIRDPRQFWGEWAQRHPNTLSRSNRYRIEELNLSPRVDRTWAREFPEHAPFRNQTLEHHHYNQGPIAIPLPWSVHRGAGNYGIWHGP